MKHNHGLAVMGISFFVSLLCLPLYLKAEESQKKEREIQTRMAKKTAVIKKYFKGDERHMVLSMYYRENHYHPLMALRSSLSLLTQIPFFIAAYSFLSHFELLRGESFFFIKDLGAPDKLLSIGGFSINVLPILMTLINAVSGAVYSKGFSLRERLRLYIVALIFLALLYHSPAALTLYWTCNNIFSLAKNTLAKFKHPERILYFGMLAAFFAALIYVLYFRPYSQSGSKKITKIAFALFAGIPVYLAFIHYAGKKYFSHLKEMTKDAGLLFFLSCAALFSLCGLFIPLNIVASDPFEFALIAGTVGDRNPFSVLRQPVLASFGLFVFWSGYIFFLASRKLKLIFSFGISVLLFAGIINTFFFSGEYGMLSRTLSFPEGTDFAGAPSFWMINLMVIFIVFLLVLVMYRVKKIKILSALTVICLAGFIPLIVLKSADIQKGRAAYKAVSENNAGTASTPAPPPQSPDNAEIQPVITLSKTGKNVVVIMLDRAVGSYLPLVFNDLEYLKNKFAGFVYYPNTVSFYSHTILGAPPLFGGYEYTPENSHKRKDLLMRDKYSEATLMMPTLFKSNGYSASIFDIPYVNFTDAQFFTEKGVSVQNFAGEYADLFLKRLGESALLNSKPELRLRRNFVMLGLFMISPPVLRKAIYRDGSYWDTMENNRQDFIGGINSYSILYFLPELTKTADSGNDFILLANQLPHEELFLQYPEYKLTSQVTDFGPDFFNGDPSSLMHYHVNAASYILLARWFDALREMGVYDNTRIIIAADHDTVAYGTGGNVKPLLPEIANNGCNPVLLAKDFSASGDIKTDPAFMTNADVPLIAVNGIIPGAKNPFTGNELKPDKENGVNILQGDFGQPRDYPGYAALDKNSHFLHVKDSIFVKENWTGIFKEYADGNRR
ncbi:MAG: membrane protein insertase YidC [Treponema sp.]|nr:membrane protein insertase YidC [Treponema sp.]